MAVLEIVGAHPVFDDSELEHMVAFERALGLDYVGAQFGHDSRAGRACDEMSEVEDVIALQHECLLLHYRSPQGARAVRPTPHHTKVSRRLSIKSAGIFAAF